MPERGTFGHPVSPPWDRVKYSKRSIRNCTCVAPMSGKIIDSRGTLLGTRRNHVCETCGNRYTTYEIHAEALVDLIGRQACNLFEKPMGEVLATIMKENADD